MAADSGLFVARPAINGQNFLAAEAQLPIEETVEAPERHIQDPADAGEVDVRIQPDPVGFHQASKVRISSVEC